MDSSIAASQYQKDRQNEVSARPYSNDTGNRLQLYTGKVKTVNANNTYEVEIYGDDGVTVLATYNGVFVPGNTAAYSVNDLVELKFSNKDYPTILATGGGGGSSCSVGINNFGVLFG